MSTVDSNANSKHQIGGNPIETFITQAKLIKDTKSAAELVKHAIEAQGVYVFSEIIDEPTVKQIATGEFAPYWELLNIFAYGTYQDYLQKKSTLPDLGPSELRKLQYLTIVTLSEKGKCIPYTNLLKELNLTNVRELEDLIIEAIYAEIFQGKLDQKRGLLEVDTTIGRDIRYPDDIPTIRNTLESWCDACENVLTTLQTQVDRANTERTLKIQRKAELNVEIESLKKSVKIHNPESDEMMISDSREAMGVDKTQKKVN